MLSIFMPYLATVMVVSSMLSAHCSAAASCSEHLEMALAEPSGVVSTCGISNLITLRFPVIGGVGLQTYVDACPGGGRQAAMVSRHLAPCMLAQAGGGKLRWSPDTSLPPPPDAV